jgi:peptidoglycan hydrolase-like protein with peptidoglycan-binding domain
MTALLSTVLLVPTVPAPPAAAASLQAARVQEVSARTVTPAVAGPRPTLHSGSKGAAVKRLQKRLVALHYDVGKADGVFGSNTLHAVYAFQKVQRLDIDGVVGPDVWRKLAHPHVPKPTHRRKAASIEVNLTLRVVFQTKNRKVTKILDASPGKPSTPTVTGSFTITRRIDGWRRSHLGLLWRPNYFHGGYALHGEGSVPTYAASHGCVRLTISAMNRLWPQLKIGEHVYVYH